MNANDLFLMGIRWKHQWYRQGLTLYKRKYFKLVMKTQQNFKNDNIGIPVALEQHIKVLDMLGSFVVIPYV